MSAVIKPLIARATVAASADFFTWAARVSAFVRGLPTTAVASGHDMAPASATTPIDSAEISETNPIRPARRHPVRTNTRVGKGYRPRGVIPQDERSRERDSPLIHHPRR